MTEAKGCNALVSKKNHGSYNIGGSNKTKSSHQSVAYPSNCNQIPGIPLPWPSSSLVAIQSAAMLFSAPVPPASTPSTSDISSSTLCPVSMEDPGVKLSSRQSMRKRRISDRETCDKDRSSPGSDDSIHNQLNSGVGATSRLHTLNDSRIHNLKWMAYKIDTWATMCSGALEELHPPSFTVEADKGFNFSTVDDSFVCQKKNHFQVTVNIGVINQPKFLKINKELKPIKYFGLSLYGIKLESESTTIDLEQSAVDRSKKPFKSHKVDLSGCEDPIRITIGRLHFSHTTENNMRKKGRPNPEQKYFSLVVSLNAFTTEEEMYTVLAHVSERIIVRASNPSNFEIDCDSLWIKGQETDSIYFCGKVGVNADTPTEALSVTGNINLTGQLLQPSDARLKEAILPVQSCQQLDNIRKLGIYSFSYKPSIAKRMRCEGQRTQVGFLAQQVREVIPEAVKEVESNLLSCIDGGESGGPVLNLDKDRIFVECVGAIQRLDALLSSMDQRLANMENYLFSN